IGECVINAAMGHGSFVDCAKAVAGCLSEKLDKLFCIVDIVECARQTFGAKAAGLQGVKQRGDAARDDAGKFYLKGVSLMVDVFDLVTGSTNDVWFGRGQYQNAGRWFARFFAFTEAGSQEGNWITESERTSLLSGELPVGVPVKELNRIIERWNRTMETSRKEFTAQVRRRPAPTLTLWT
ncbi:MAG: hypothetical protein N3G20_03770, partial [Verrucomicrobiae bacterium]|nr:hypothetical protein [Verrucomicrobiae bacterium]